MDFPEEKFGKEMEKNIPVLSEYAKNLEGHVKKRYVQKILWSEWIRHAFQANGFIQKIFRR